MRAFALTCEALASLDRIQTKVQCAAAYLSSRPGTEITTAARFLAGSPLPPGTTAPRIGQATIINLVAGRAEIKPEALRRSAIRKGDLGEAVEAALKKLDPEAMQERPLSVSEVADTLSKMGDAGPSQRSHQIDSLFERADSLEAKYLTKLLLGSLRTGMQSGRVEETIALAYRCQPEVVRRAHMMLGDIGLVAYRAALGRLGDVELRSFRPVRSMLPYKVDNVDAVVARMTPPFQGEHVYDGVRAQLHISDDRWRLYTRGLEECTHLFPEIADVTKYLSGDWIFDGGVVAYSDRVLPFSGLQQRLGRLQVPLTLLLDVPVVYFAFDVLRAEGQDLIDAPLRDRRGYLEDLPAEAPMQAMPSTIVTSRGDIEAIYDQSMQAGGIGAIFKDLDSPYRPGSRGRGWLQLKVPMASLQVVVTSARYGVGKRAGLLSDLTLAVRGPDGFVNVGKAYSGLTDAEIRQLTEQLKASTVSRFEATHTVEPKIVLEVAFGGVQVSQRHSSGFALRYPRIVRLCPETEPDDVDSIDRVVELLEIARDELKADR